MGGWGHWLLIVVCVDRRPTIGCLVHRLGSSKNDGEE